MIPPNTKITCSKCHLHIATTNIILETDEDDGSIYWDDLDFVNSSYLKHTKINGTNCPKCFSSWSDTGGYIHSEHGWESI